MEEEIDTGIRLLGYELLEKLGEGGWGQVWKAQSEAGKVVAVKILMPRDGWKNKNRELLMERFRREVLVISQLQSPYSVHAIGGCGKTSGGTLAFAMDYLEGQTLRNYVSIGNRPTAEQIRRWTAQLLEAMREFHSKGIVHRDIKPDNIMLLPNGNVKLFDFGICKWVSTDSNLTTQQAPRTVLYASPEQLLDSDDIDSRSDYYSLGKVIYFLATGRTPIAGMLGDHVEEIQDFLLRHIVEMLTAEDLNTRAANIRTLWQNDFKWLLSDDVTTVDMCTDKEEPTSVDLGIWEGDSDDYDSQNSGLHNQLNEKSSKNKSKMFKLIAIMLCAVLISWFFFEEDLKNARKNFSNGMEQLEFSEIDDTSNIMNFNDSDSYDVALEPLISPKPPVLTLPDIKENIRQQVNREEEQESNIDWKTLSPDELDSYCRRLLPKAKRGVGSAKKELFEIYRNNQQDISVEVMNEIQALAD